MTNSFRTPFKIHDENSSSGLLHAKSTKKVAFQSQSNIGPFGKDGVQSVLKSGLASAAKSNRKALSNLSTSQVNARTGSTALTPGLKGPPLVVKESGTGVKQKKLISTTSAVQPAFTDTSAGFSIKVDAPEKEDTAPVASIAIEEPTKELISEKEPQQSDPLVCAMPREAANLPSENISDEEMLCSGVHPLLSPFEIAMRISKAAPMEVQEPLFMNSGAALDEDLLANLNDEQWNAISPEDIELVFKQLEQDIDGADTTFCEYGNGDGLLNL